MSDDTGILWLLYDTAAACTLISWETSSFFEIQLFRKLFLFFRTEPNGYENVST